MDFATYLAHSDLSRVRVMAGPHHAIHCVTSIADLATVIRTRTIDVVVVDTQAPGLVDVESLGPLLASARPDGRIGTDPWIVRDQDAILTLALLYKLPESPRRGDRRLLELAREAGARFLMASTSEIYGDPEVHPQVESYRGNVDPTGPRSVYDEAKRFSESLTMAMHRTYGVDVGIVRIFNTYGPRLSAGDGRVVSNFIVQALQGTPLTVYGDGSQTRSLCFVDDEIRGLVALMDSSLVGPVNIGNPVERTILELAYFVLEVTGSASDIVFEPLPTDDPTRRRPDIALARRELAWEPRIGIREGIERTIEYFADRV